MIIDIWLNDMRIIGLFQIWSFSNVSKHKINLIIADTKIFNTPILQPLIFLHFYNNSLLKCFNFLSLQFFNTSILWHSNSSTLQFFNNSIFQQFNSSTSHFFNTSFFNNLNLQLFSSSILQLLIPSILLFLSLIHIWRCRRYAVCRSRWSPYH